MNQQELLQNLTTQMDEILELRKSIDANIQKEAAPAAPSDAESDAVHAADEGSDPKAYAAKLSDEELYSLISVLSEEADQRGVGEDQPAAQGAPDQEQAQESAPEQSEAPAQESAPQEGMEPQEGEESVEESIEQKVAGLSDEEIQTLMASLEQELSMRQSQAQAPAAQAPGQEMAMSMEKAKKDMAQKAERMEKSVSTMIQGMDALAKQISSLTSEVSTLKKSAAAPKTDSLPVQKYAGSKNLVVLEKSVAGEEAEPLLGAELAHWLVDQRASKQIAVPTLLVSRANLCKSVEDAAGIYADIKALGLTPPTRK